MTISQMRGKIEDFLYDLRRFSNATLKQDIEDKCKYLIKDLDDLDTMLLAEEHAKDFEVIRKLKGDQL